MLVVCACVAQAMVRATPVPLLSAAGLPVPTFVTIGGTAASFINVALTSGVTYSSCVTVVNEAGVSSIEVCSDGVHIGMVGSEVGGYPACN